MRRFFYLALTVTVLLTRGYRVFGQVPLSTDHYDILGEDPAAGERIAQDLEERFAIYTRLFRFNPGLLASPLKVRLIGDTAAYDEYLVGRLGATNSGALYLHYRQAERRELVINYAAANNGDATGDGVTGGGTRADWERALPYQSFIQYLRAFIPSPPAWLEEGFAIYFSTLSIKGGELAYAENLSWLERVKELTIPPVQDILLQSVQDSGDSLSRADYSALSWALVSFFLNSGNEDYIRSLLECFMLLSPDAGLEENSIAAAQRIGDWNGFENLDRDYRSYISSRKTFSELMNEGRDAYGQGSYDEAEQAFAGAAVLRPDHNAPHYYLGLIAYGRGDWVRAEQYYSRSLELGGDTALVYYALGLNAAAAEQGERAAEFLHRAVAADPARYREKANVLLRRLPSR
ncbi:MAG: tetratricopeptide repeat protein [Treponema sp.]|jgi:tetratricopeptide (TPR) repeat protein|nr:tetratricopeptide repeat protein [Treponema sp.]